MRACLVLQLEVACVASWFTILVLSLRHPHPRMASRCSVASKPGLVNRPVLYFSLTRRNCLPIQSRCLPSTRPSLPASARDSVITVVYIFKLKHMGLAATRNPAKVIGMPAKNAESGCQTCEGIITQSGIFTLDPEEVSATGSGAHRRVPLGVVPGALSGVARAQSESHTATIQLEVINARCSNLM